jgi:uncharacterized membrane protein
MNARMTWPLGLEMRLLLGIGALFGVASILIVPPASVYDAPSHYFRALQVSEGTLRPEKYSERAAGGMLPRGHVEFVNTLWGQYWAQHSFGSPREWDGLSKKFAADTDRARVEFTNTSVYSPANYVFQSVGIRLSMAFGNSPIRAHRTACLFNLGGYLLIVAAAIGRLPRYQKGFLLAATTPLNLWQAASVSADAINFAIPLLLFAWILHLRSETSAKPLRGVAVAMGIGMLLALLKPNAIVLLASLLFIPGRCFGRGPVKYWVLAPYFLCAAGLWLAWNHANLTIDIARWYQPELPDMSVQKQYFISHPLSFVAPFFRFIIHGLPDQLAPAYATVGAVIPESVYRGLAYLALVFAVGFVACPSWEGRADWMWSAGMLLQSLAILVAIALALWLALGHPADPMIPGFGGRYLPVPIFCASLAWAEASHRGLPRLRNGLFWVAIGANCAALTVMISSIASRVL